MVAGRPAHVGARSRWWTDVVVLASLSVVVDSRVVVVAAAMLARTVPSATSGSTRTTTVNTALPTAIDWVEQVTVPVVRTAGTAQAQPTGSDDDTNVVPTGSVSLTVATAAGSGPALVTVMVYVSTAPESTGSGSSVMAVESSAVGKRPTTMGSRAELRYGDAGWYTTRGGTSAEPSGFCSAAISPVSRISSL